MKRYFFFKEMKKNIKEIKRIFKKWREKSSGNLQKTRFYSKKTKKFLQIKIKDEIFNDTWVTV